MGFFLPFCIICACYTLIGRVLMKARPPANGQRRGGRLKALRMIVAAVTVFFVCWLPENVFIAAHLLRGATGPSRRRGNSTLWQQYPLTGHLVTLAACANSCLNPLLYSLIGGTFVHKLRLFVKHHAHCNIFTHHHHHHHAQTHTHPACPHQPHLHNGDLRHSLVDGGALPGEGECVCSTQHRESTSDFNV